MHDDPVIVNWDYAGIASLAEEGNNIKSNHFSATLKNWKAFTNGSFTAPVGVMTGKIIINGNPLSIIPYAANFTQVAKVAKKVTNPTELI